MPSPMPDSNRVTKLPSSTEQTFPLLWGNNAKALDVQDLGNSPDQSKRPALRIHKPEPPLRRSLPGIQVQSTSLYVPPNRVTNEHLAKYGYESEWVFKRTGIKSRYIAGPEESTGDMAIKAGRDCLKLAGVHPSEVDFILVATMTSDHSTPTCANLVQAGLGCACPAIDINSACSGFMYAMIMGSQFLATGCSRRVLVIGAEKTSLLADPADKKTYPLFGDGAGAVLLGMHSDHQGILAQDDSNQDGLHPKPQQSHNRLPEAADETGILAYRLASMGELGQSLVVPAGGSREPMTADALAAGRNYLKMEGRTVFKWAVRLVPEIIKQLLEDADLEIGDIDLLIMHQANRRIISAALEDIDIPEEKVFVNVERYGNTSAASIPIALHEAVVQGQVARGSKVMLIGFGGGLTWGGCIMQW